MRQAACVRLWRGELVALDHFEVQDQNDCGDKQCNNPKHDDLVGHDATRHAGERPAGSSNVVVCPMQRIPRMNDRLALPVQILQYADS